MPRASLAAAAIMRHDANDVNNAIDAYDVRNTYSPFHTARESPVAGMMQV
jgi:hypothetical protein